MAQTSNSVSKQSMKILSCLNASVSKTCKSAYQDEKYSGKRAMNPSKDGYRCTVCGKIGQD